MSRNIETMKDILLPDLGLKDFKYIYPLFDLIKNGIAITNDESKILYVNPYYSIITGYSSNEVIGKNPGILRSGYHDEKFYKNMWADMLAKGFWEGEIWNRKKSGTIYPSLLTISKIKNTSKNIVNYIALFSDMTFMKQNETEKLNLAFYDPLTKLPNRLFLEEHFNQIAGKYNRYRRNKSSQSSVDEKMAFVFFDLNKFKKVNDTHGHLVGDKLLKQIAERMKKITRKSEFVSRLGGDEFVAIITELVSRKGVDEYCKRIEKAFQNPFQIDELQINSSCSIGTSIFPDDGTSFEALLEESDKEMYLKKADVLAR